MENLNVKTITIKDPTITPPLNSLRNRISNNVSLNNTNVDCIKKMPLRNFPAC
jgi:hypothetical protein